MDETRESVVVLAWSQTRVDGWVGLSIEDLEAGMTFRWQGEPISLTGVSHLNSRMERQSQVALRAKAARAVKRLMQDEDAVTRPIPEPEGEHAGGDLVVSDGRKFFSLQPVVNPTSEPLLLAKGALPPAGRDLTIIRAPEQRGAQTCEARALGLSSDTTIATPEGWRTVGELRVGDLVFCKDHKLQPVLWCRSLPLPTAPADMPASHRPIRVKAQDPSLSITVNPGQRILMTGQVLRALWAEETALIEAQDLLDTPWASPDHIGGLARYTQIVLPTHDLVATPCGWVDSAEPHRLQDLSRMERRTLGAALDAADAQDACRRVLTKAEAAIALDGDPQGLHPVAH